MDNLLKPVILFYVVKMSDLKYYMEDFCVFCHINLIVFLTYRVQQVALWTVFMMTMMWMMSSLFRQAHVDAVLNFMEQTDTTSKTPSVGRGELHQ